jgi:hypothetical protein
LWGAAISVLAVSVVVVAGEAGTCIGHLTVRVVDWIRADVSLLAGRSSSKTCAAALAMLGGSPYRARSAPRCGARPVGDADAFRIAGTSP